MGKRKYFENIFFFFFSCFKKKPLSPTRGARLSVRVGLFRATVFVGVKLFWFFKPPPPKKKGPLVGGTLGRFCFAQEKALREKGGGAAL